MPISVALLVDNLERAVFFSYVGLGLAHQGCNVHYICDSPASFRWLKRREKQVWFAHEWTRDLTRTLSWPDTELDQMTEYERKAYGLSSRRCREMAVYYVRAFQVLYDVIDPTVVVCWNGCLCFAAAGVAVATARGTRKVYMEKGYLPRTVIVDPRGVNYGGTLTCFVPQPVNRRPDLSRVVPADSGGAEMVRSLRLADRFWEAAVNASCRVVSWRGYRRFVPGEPFRSAVKLLSETRVRHASSTGNELEIPPNSFLFPLQVQKDSQVIKYFQWHYAPTELAELCLSALPGGYTLVVKEHPAERDRGYLRNLKKILTESQAILVPPDIDSRWVIDRVHGVVTINSTVGFEALARYKPVIVLGQAFYARKGITLDVSNPSDMARAFQTATRWKPDPALVNGLLSYLVSEYLVRADYPFLDPGQACNLARMILRRSELQ